VVVVLQVVKTQLTLEVLEVALDGLLLRERIQVVRVRRGKVITAETLLMFLADTHLLVEEALVLLGRMGLLLAAGTVELDYVQQLPAVSCFMAVVVAEVSLRILE
jgi:hypothetical protein